MQPLLASVVLAVLQARPALCLGGGEDAAWGNIEEPNHKHLQQKRHRALRRHVVHMLNHRKAHHHHNIVNFTGAIPHGHVSISHGSVHHVGKHKRPVDTTGDSQPVRDFVNVIGASEGAPAPLHALRRRGHVRVDSMDESMAMPEHGFIHALRRSGGEPWSPGAPNARVNSMDGSVAMPEHGFSGRPVAHEDTLTVTSDWRAEYGPKARGRWSYREICAEHPENLWCRLNDHVAWRHQGHGHREHGRKEGHDEGSHEEHDHGKGATRSRTWVQHVKDFARDSHKTVSDNLNSTAAGEESEAVALRAKAAEAEDSASYAAPGGRISWSAEAALKVAAGREGHPGGRGQPSLQPLFRSSDPPSSSGAGAVARGPAWTLAVLVTFQLR